MLGNYSHDAEHSCQCWAVVKPSIVIISHLSPLRGVLMPSSPSCLPLTFQHLYSHFHEGAIFLLQLGFSHRTKLSWDPAK